MYKYLLLAFSLPLFSGAALAQSDDTIIEKLDGSHFQRSDIFKGKVWGSGKCTVSGNRNWNGGCRMERFTMGSLNRYDIHLSDGETLYRIVQRDAGGKNHYFTRISGKDVKTTIKQISDKEAIFTIGHMKVHMMLDDLKERTDPAFSHETSYGDDEAYQIMARGQGSCKLSGKESFSGDCSIELMSRGMLDERYDIHLDDAQKSLFHILKLTDGSKRYVTRIGGKDIATTIKDIRKKKHISTESIITFGDKLKLHITLKKVQIRKGP